MSNEYDYADDEEIHSTKHSTNDKVYDLNKNLEFSVDLIFPVIKLKKNETQSIQANITLKLKEGGQSIQNGVDLICVIDRSASMSGEKMEMVKETLKKLLNFLKEKDRLCLVQFDTGAQRLTPLLRTSAKNIAQFEQVIDSIGTGGGTKISSGTEIAFEQIKKRKYKNKVTSIFLLSDGEDSSAEEEVKEQLEQLDEPFTIHSFGYGTDYDAKMMTSICSLKNGGCYFVHDYTFLEEFFVNTLGGLVSVAAENIEIQLRQVAQAPFDGIRITNTYGNLWEQFNELDYRIAMPQISQGNSKDFVFELTIPKYDAQMGNLPKIISVIDATLELKSTQTNQIIKKQKTVDLQILEETAQVPQIKEKIEVVTQIYRVQATDTIEKARIACEHDNFEEAQVKLDNTITVIKTNQNATKVSKGIVQNLEQAKQAAQKENFEKFGKNQMFQIVSNNYAQSGINANFDENGVQNQQGVVIQYQNKAQIKLTNLVKIQKNEKIQEEPFEDLTENQLLIGHTGVVLGVDICQERNLLASGSADKTVKLWNLENNTLIKTYTYNGPVQNVVFSNEGSLLAFGGGFDYSIQIIDISDLEKDVMPSKLRGHYYYINRIIFSNDSKYLISGSDDQTVRIWDIQSKQEAEKFTSDSQVKGVAISSDNNLIASNSKNGQIQIWNSQNKQQQCSHNSKQGGCGIQFSNDQNMLISSHQSGKIILWSLEKINDNELVLKREFNVGTRWIWTALFTSCSRFIISIANQDGQIKVIDPEIDDVVYERKYEQSNYCYSVGVALSKNMKIMSYGQDNNVSVWRKELQINE